MEQDITQALPQTLPTLQQDKLGHGLFPILHPKAPAMTLQATCQEYSRDVDSFKTGPHSQELKVLLTQHGR